MAERKGQDGQRFEDTPSLNIAMGEWGSEVHRSLHDVLFRVTHVLKFFLWRVVDSAIQACGGVRGTLGRMTNGALNRALGVLVARHSKKHCSWVESRELPPELTYGALNRNVCNWHDELFTLCTNQKARARDVLMLMGGRTKW